MKDYAAQELSQAAYCRQVGLSPATFSHWFRQLHAKGERPEAGARRQTFAEVVFRVTLFQGLFIVTKSALRHAVHGGPCKA